jgi:hypothetical protein
MKTKLLKLICGLALLGAASPAYSQSLLVNGDFENGSLAGWTVVDQTGGSGTFGISTPGASTPLSGHSTASNPGGGSYYAVSDQSGGGAHALIQTFTIGSTPQSVTLNFQMFVNNWAPEEYVNPAGLDYTASPNEFASVDILSESAGAFDTGAGVLDNLYLGADPTTTANGFTSYSFDITSVVSNPGTYQLRFAEADNIGFFNVGVDNVSIELDTAPVPEPSTLALSAVAGLGLLRFRRRK